MKALKVVHKFFVSKPVERGVYPYFLPLTVETRKCRNRNTEKMKKKVLLVDFKCGKIDETSF